jgi:hypothetical protein
MTVGFRMVIAVAAASVAAVTGCSVSGASAATPASPGPNGKLTPQYRNVLAWVVYGVPRTPILGCGGWSVTAFNAVSGSGMEAVGTGS